MVAGFANGDIDLIGHGMEDELAEHTGKMYQATDRSRKPR